MTYPTQLTLKILQAEHPEYAAVKAHLEKIRLLAEGGWRLRERLPEFLKQRPGEEDEIYEARLEKFSYSNVLGGAISQLSSKITSGTVHLSNAEPESFWEEFREDTNGQGRTELQLIEKLFSEGLKYRTVFAHVDKPTSPQQPRNRAEEEALGLRSKVVLYPAIQVPLYKERNGQLEWLKVYQISDHITPFSNPLKLARWKFIDSTYIATYESFVKLDSQGQILELLDEQGEPLPLDEEPKVSLVSLVQHGFGSIPVTRLELPDDKWSTNQAYGIAEQCLRLECHRYDLLTAAYLQRTYKPIQSPDHDLDNSYTSSDDPLPTGLQYVLELDRFEWAEPEGKIIPSINSSLEQAEKQIRTLLGTGGAYVQEAVEASGVSKAMDFVIEDERLKAYGHLLTDCLQDLYQLVSKAEGQSNPGLAVSGLDEFGGDRLDDLIDTLTKLLSIDMTMLERALTPSLYLLIREKLLSLLMGNLNPEQRGKCLDELRMQPSENQADQQVQTV